MSSEPTTPEPADTVIDELIRDAANDFWTEIQCEIEVHNFPTVDRFREIFREATSKAVAAKDAECEKEAGFRVVLMQTLQLLQSRASPIPCTCGCEGCRGDREAIRSYIGDWVKQLDRIDDGDFGPADQAIAANIKRIAKLESELADAVKNRDRYRACLGRIKDVCEMAKGIPDAELEALSKSIDWANEAIHGKSPTEPGTAGDKENKS